MGNYLHNAKHDLVGAWLPEHDPDVVIPIWETRSITIDASLFTADVFYNTYLIEELNADSLEGLRSLLHEQYGPAQESDEHGVFSHAAQIHQDELVDA